MIRHAVLRLLAPLHRAGLHGVSKDAPVAVVARNGKVNVVVEVFIILLSQAREGGNATCTYASRLGPDREGLLEFAARQRDRAPALL